MGSSASAAQRVSARVLWPIALLVASFAFMAGLVFLANVGRYGSAGALAGALLAGGGAAGAVYAFSRAGGAASAASAVSEPVPPGPTVDSNLPSERRPER